MKGSFQYLQYIQILSLDVAVGSVIGTLFVADLLGVRLPGLVLLVLFLVVWLIYTLDHLLDVRTTYVKPLTPRHIFHWRYSGRMWGVWSFLMIATLSLVFKLPSRIVAPGVILSLMVAGYFISTKLLHGQNIYHKEIAGALLYAGGIFIGPVTLGSESIIWRVWVLYSEIALLAFLNLILFSMFERDIDEKEGFESLVISMGERPILMLYWALCIVLFITTFVTLLLPGTGQNWVLSQTVILSMTAATAGLAFWRSYFQKSLLYRLTGDAVFFIPAIALVL